MALPIIYRASNPNGRSVVIRRDAETQEYIVQFFVDMEYLSLSDYFTPDKDDAFATAQAHLTGKYA